MPLDLVAEQLKIEDADEIVALMDAVLERVYQEPAQVARIRDKRERRNEEDAEPASPTDGRSESNEFPRD